MLEPAARVVATGFGVREIASRACIAFHTSAWPISTTSSTRIFMRELVLPQLAHALILVDSDVTSARLEIAAEDFNERGLAAAVGADQAVAVALTELDRDVFEQRLAVELHSDARGNDHSDNNSGDYAKAPQNLHATLVDIRE
jgi:hypothetical protein